MAVASNPPLAPGSCQLGQRSATELASTTTLAPSRGTSIREKIAHFGNDPPGGLPLGHPLNIGIAVLEALAEAIPRRARSVWGECHIRQGQQWVSGVRRLLFLGIETGA